MGTMERMIWLAVVSAAAAFAAEAAWSAEVRPWEKPHGIPAESELLRERLEEPQNHFLLDGTQGFISGREFYQAVGESTPFLWPSQPFLRYGPDRAWQSDSVPLVFHAWGGNEVGEPNSLVSGDVGLEVLEGLRLHGGIDQNEEYASGTYPARLGLAGADNRGKLAWFGDRLPPKSQANLGAAFEHRGTNMAVQANRGWWWTASPVSGRVYPWEGYNAELVYKVGQDFDLSLVDQEWDSPITRPFYHSHWGRSELNMGFLGSSEGAWVWRLDVGFQRREMISDSLFHPFLEKTTPTRFRYHQTWSAPDSIPLQMNSSGSMGFRDRIIALQHNSEFLEKWDTHLVRENVKGYYRYPMEGYKVPTERLPGDTTWLAEYTPGVQPRGISGEWEYREKRKAFEVGMSGIYALEWELPLFHLQQLDTLDGAILRSGSYSGSDYLLQNTTVRIFASGGFGTGSDSSESGDYMEHAEHAGHGSSHAYWRVQAGWRDFWGHDAAAMEFRPSREWAGIGGGWSLPFHLNLDAQVNYVGEKEVRGWGPVFNVPSHFENNLAVSQALLDNGLKLSLSALHAFGEDFRDQPNANPMRFRVLAGVEGAF